MFMGLLLSVSPALAGSGFVEVGARDVRREGETLDAITLAAGPSWGPWGLRIEGSVGLGDLAPSSVDLLGARALGAVGGDVLGFDLSRDRATLSVEAQWSPPVGAHPMIGGPRAMVGVEGRLIEYARISEGGGEPPDTLAGWGQSPSVGTLGIGPTLGLGWALSPFRGALLHLDLRDRMLFAALDRPSTLDDPDGAGIRHDVTLSLNAGFCFGGAP